MHIFHFLKSMPGYKDTWVKEQGYEGYQGYQGNHRQRDRQDQ